MADRRARARRGALRRLAGQDRGAGAVEFALVAPIAIVLALGAMEIGRALSAQARISHAAKETARFAAVHGSASGAPASGAALEAMALDAANLAPERTTATVSWDPDNRPGATVLVQLEHDFLPVTIPFRGGGFTFTSSASVTVLR